MKTVYTLAIMLVASFLVNPQQPYQVIAYTSPYTPKQRTLVDSIVKMDKRIDSLAEKRQLEDSILHLKKSKQ